MHKLDLNIARLKLLLADITAKREALEATRQQYQEQIARMVSFTIHEDVPVERSLAMIMDVDVRLLELTRQQHYLDLIRTRAQRELDSLQLTKLIEETRAQIAVLQLQQVEEDTMHGADWTGLAWIAGEIRRLEGVIAAASEAAAKSISTGSRRSL